VLCCVVLGMKLSSNPWKRILEELWMGSRNRVTGCFDAAGVGREGLSGAQAAGSVEARSLFGHLWGARLWGGGGGTQA